MKRAIWASFLAAGLWACNDSTDHSTTGSDTANHSGHGEATAAATGNNPMKAMHDAMSKMMNDMKAMQPTGDADYDFAMMMKHHHQSAVDMTTAELQGGTDTAMQSMAAAMKESQQKEIAQFDTFLQGVQNPTGNSTYGQQAMGMMTPMSEMKMESGSVDAMFASMMIPHHQDGVKMATAYLKEGKNDNLRAIAQKIIREQQSEITDLQEWLRTKGNTAP